MIFTIPLATGHWADAPADRKSHVHGMDLNHIIERHGRRGCAREESVARIMAVGLVDLERNEQNEDSPGQGPYGDTRNGRPTEPGSRIVI